MIDWKSNLRKSPSLGKGVYLAPSAVAVGDIKIGDHSSLWPNVSARGDVNWIRIGSRTNIQDNSVLHVTVDTNPLDIGDDVTVGHGVHVPTEVLEVIRGFGSMLPHCHPSLLDTDACTNLGLLTGEKSPLAFLPNGSEPWLRSRSCTVTVCV